MVAVIVEEQPISAENNVSERAPKQLKISFDPAVMFSAKVRSEKAVVKKRDQVSSNYSAVPKDLTDIDHISIPKGNLNGSHIIDRSDRLREEEEVVHEIDESTN